MGKLYSYTYVSWDGAAESPEKWTSPFFGEALSADLASRLEGCAGLHARRRCRRAHP